MTEEKKCLRWSKAHAIPPQAQGEKVVIRLASGGQPATGIIESYNPYECFHQTAKGQILVFKHAIATIEAVNEPKGLQDNKGEFKADEEIFSKSSWSYSLDKLANHAGKLEPSDLRPCMGIRYADLDLSLEELAKEGRIEVW